MRRTLLFLGLLLLSSPVRATSVLLDGDIVRPTRHSGNWTPSSLYAPVLSFVADGPEVVLQFSAQVHSSSTASWLRQAVDNVAVTTRAVYDAHLLARNPADLTNYFWMQIEASYPIFFFDYTAVSPSDLKFFDQFGTGVSSAWDITNGGYYLDPSNLSFAHPSAPTNDLVDPSNTSGGSLGLGQDADLVDPASAHVVVAGLQAGTEYVVSFWWLSDNDNIDEHGDPNPNGDLFVKVFSADPVQVEAKTWTGIKALYRSGP